MFVGSVYKKVNYIVQQIASLYLHLEMFATTLAVPLFLRLYVQNKIWGGGGLCMSSPANRFFDSVMVAGADLNLDQTRVMSTDAKK